MLMMSLFSLYFQQVFGLRFCPAAYRSACIVTIPTLQVDRHHRHHRNHLRAKNNQKPIQAVPKKQSGLVFQYYFNILFIIVCSSPTRDSMNAHGYSGYSGDGQMYNGGQAAQPSMLHMGRNKHRHPTHRRNRCIARKYKGFRRALCHAADEVPACVVTVVTVVTVNCRIQAANGAAIGSACRREHSMHPGIP